MTTMLTIIFSWLADRLEGGDRLQRPSRPPSDNHGLSFFTDAKAEDGRAWVGGFLEIVPGCQGPWFSLEVDRSWAPWAFSKSSPNKVIAALELLATLIAVKLWVRDSDERQSSRVATRGFTDNQSNEALVKKDPEGQLHLSSPPFPRSALELMAKGPHKPALFLWLEGIA